MKEGNKKLKSIKLSIDFLHIVRTIQKLHVIDSQVPRQLMIDDSKLHETPTSLDDLSKY